MNTKNDLILKTTILFLTIGILMSFKLWINDRNFPQIPLFEIPNFSHFFSYALIVGFLGMMIIRFFFESRILTLGIFCLLILYAMQDQMRWQPWTYHYLLFLVPFCFQSKKHNAGYFQIIIIGIYLWGGIHKINQNFIDQIFPNFLFAITNCELENFKEIGYLIPLIEVLIAFGLLFQKTQKYAVFGACLTHIVILIYLSPLGSNSNSIVIPWNIAMLLFLYLCFLKKDYESPVRNLWKDTNRNIKLPIVCLFLTFPILNFWGKWDYYLSFNLYSGKSDVFYIAIEENEIKHLKIDFRDEFEEIPELTGGALIDVNKWSINELNIPIPPEKRIFKEIARSFCDLGISDEKIMFLEIERPIKIGNMKSYSCKELE